MPTKRVRRGPRRIRDKLPEWARRLIETGEEPALDGGPDECAYVGWLFWDEPCGLPPAGSPEGQAILARRKGRR